MEKKNALFVKLGICVGLLLLIWSGFLFEMRRVNRTIEQVREDDFSWVVQVDKVRREESKIILEGFAFYPSQKAEEAAYSIILRDMDTGKYYFPKMQYLIREDVNDYFLGDYDYTYSGFVATINDNKLSLDEKNYDVLLLPKGTHCPYKFSTYLSGGKLMYVDPTEFKSIVAEGTDLEEIINNGIIRIYDPKNHIYVYQHDWELYWIVEEDYEFEKNGDTYIQWHLETNQIERLPEERLKEQWYFDNLGFVFSAQELLEGDFGKYRVAKKSLPNEYAIRKMNTGKNNGDWLWKEDFRPYYDFDGVSITDK